MRTKALYFPYINLPDDNWLYLMLLYWDQLSSIMPHDYAYKPERLSPHMSTLMKEGLLNPVIPQDFIHDVEDFGAPFISYVRCQVKQTQLKRRATSQRVPIHVEKLGRVADELVELNLATSTGYPWYEMDSWVANAFMSYLASLIGNLPEIDSAPITNDASCFQLLGGNQKGTFAERSRQRQVILKEIFPFPDADLNLHSVVRFKRKYGEELARFRDKIEGLCIELSNITDLNDREQKRQIATRELREQIDLISGRMHETWRQIIFLDILPILGVGGSAVTSIQGDQMLAAGLGTLPLSGAIYSYFRQKKDRKLLLNHPLAYGALIHRRWLRNLESSRK